MQEVLNFTKSKYDNRNLTERDEMKTITMKHINKAIKDATDAVAVFNGTRDEMIKQVIEPLQVTLRAGTKAKLSCSERNTKRLFSKLQKALATFDEKASERAMRLSANH